MHEQLANATILVTGGTGFIGGRLVERLVVQYKANVRVLVRNYSRISRIARFPVGTILGNVTSPDDVSRAMDGCDYVFHCAYGNTPDERLQHQINVEGTRNVLSAAQQAQVKRVIHLSTIMVYGQVEDGDVDETFPRRKSGNVYADTKLEAEAIALDFANSEQLPVVVLQPAAVYGPFAPVWTTYVLNRLKRGRVILVNRGTGLSNAVFVDDVVNAMVLAAVKENAVGEAFIISGSDDVTWRDFYEGFQRMLGGNGLVEMSIPEAMAFHRKTMRQKRLLPLKKLARSILAPELIDRLKGVDRQDGVNSQPIQAPKREKPILPLSPADIQFYAANIRMRIDKAQKIIGYQPVFSFSDGLRYTEDWARWANLL